MNAVTNDIMSPSLEAPGTGRFGTAAGQSRAGQFAKILKRLSEPEAVGFGGLQQPDQADELNFDLLKNILPQELRHQLGSAALDQTNGDSRWGAFKSRMAADLMGLKNPGEVLLAKLSALAQKEGNLKLDQLDLATLKDILAQSGIQDERLEQALAGLEQGQLSLDRLTMATQMALSGVSEDDEQKGGLIVRDDSLPALGQLFISLGLSPEVAKNVTSRIETGEKLDAKLLRDIIGASGEVNLAAPGLGQADLANLGDLLSSLGATTKDLANLSHLLRSTQGQLSLEGFLNFLDQAAQPEPELSQAQLKQVENFLGQLNQSQEQAKTLEFNKTLTLLSALGDRQIDSNFKDLSPALQALRGGISGLRGDGGGRPDAGGHSDGRQDQRRGERESWNQALDTGRTPALKDAAVGQKLGEHFTASGGPEILARQIADKMIYSARRGIHRLTMQLNPETLGGLAVDLRVKDGRLSARLTAETPEAKMALERELESLKDTLAQAGLTVDQLEISLAHNGQGGNAGQGEPEPVPSWSSADRGSAEEPADRPDFRYPKDTDNLISRLV